MLRRGRCPTTTGAVSIGAPTKGRAVKKPKRVWAVKIPPLEGFFYCFSVLGGFFKRLNFRRVGEKKTGGFPGNFRGVSPGHLDLKSEKKIYGAPFMGSNVVVSTRGPRLDGTHWVRLRACLSISPSTRCNILDSGRDPSHETVFRMGVGGTGGARSFSDPYDISPIDKEGICGPLPFDGADLTSGSTSGGPICLALHFG